MVLLPLALRRAGPQRPAGDGDPGRAARASAWSARLRFFALVPRGRSWFATLGAATLVVYLFHGFFVLSAQYEGFPDWADRHVVASFVGHHARRGRRWRSSSRAPPVATGPQRGGRPGRLARASARGDRKADRRLARRAALTGAVELGRVRLLRGAHPGRRDGARRHDVVIARLGPGRRITTEVGRVPRGVLAGSRLVVPAAAAAPRASRSGRVPEVGGPPGQVVLRATYSGAPKARSTRRPACQARSRLRDRRPCRSAASPRSRPARPARRSRGPAARHPSSGRAPCRSS